MSIPTAPSPSPVLATETPKGDYRYEVRADRQVNVFKETDDGWELAYTVRSGACACKGFEYRGRCKHLDVAVALTEAAERGGLLPAS